MSETDVERPRVVLVTGAAGGMGATHASTLAADGWTVLLADVADATPVAEKIAADGGRATAYPLDVTDRAAWDRLVQEVREEHGALHGLVNNAGVSRRLRFMDTPPDVWSRVMAINVDGPFHGIQACAPLMRDSGGGSIVNISSIAGQIGYFSPSYSTSKWALRGLTKSAAGELAAWGIRVNSVHPGLVETPLLAGSDGFVASAVASIPLGRMGRADEISDVVRFLLGEGSTYMSGAELTVDGALVSNGTYHRILTEMDGEL
ncbi:SDR family NAD(P)-dependent oxidoreductase [Nocardioides zeae]|uniref:SDR family NAD(P)-dependent oxidoreductase n=1 Tax=Nocardioides imazamoxiresistens TaxID=3231893 RepID=A0ABU3PUS9_9ACTN|nr:SDR family NAD(P)-dependent oxidoreductase [Nocardioides zeae]MDT9592934.1 SDR family NAD(P)-dependent oxidoreductase [Nocardioides zeae]